MLKKTQVAALVRGYHAAKVAADKAKDFRSAIVAYMKAASLSTLESAGFVVTLSDVIKHNRKCDLDKLKEKFPEAYKACVTEYDSTEERLNIK